MKNKVRVTKSSGNVFADIGLPNAAEHSIKADIVLRIAARIKSKGLTQAKAASLLSLAQPDVSARAFCRLHVRPSVRLSQCLG